MPPGKCTNNTSTFKLDFPSFNKYLTLNCVCHIILDPTDNFKMEGWGFFATRWKPTAVDEIARKWSWPQWVRPQSLRCGLWVQTGEGVVGRWGLGWDLGAFTKGFRRSVGGAKPKGVTAAGRAGTFQGEKKFVFASEVLLVRVSVHKY